MATKVENTGCLSSNQKAVISADMRGISLSEGKWIERKIVKTKSTLKTSQLAPFGEKELLAAVIDLA